MAQMMTIPYIFQNIHEKVKLFMNSKLLIGGDWNVDKPEDNLSHTFPVIQ